MRKTLWIMWDHLHHDHSLLGHQPQKDVVVYFCESAVAARRFRYHKHRLTFLFSAMRHRAEELAKEGWRVDYHSLGKDSDVPKSLAAHVREFESNEVHLVEPTEWHSRQAIPLLEKKIGCPIIVHENDLFLLRRADFAKFAAGKKRLLMEHHYRAMRKRTGYLMDEKGEPEGGAWNFDHDNRSGIRDFERAGRPSAPPPPYVEQDEMTQQVAREVERLFADHPGKAATMRLPVTRDGALRWLEHFIIHRLPLFGAYEDLISEKDPLLFHSMLTPFLNCGLLRPKECCEAAISAWREKRAPLNAVEGFVRQIIGWREFVNGIYWLRMPDYEDLNALEARRGLPKWIYSGETKMRCMSHAIRCLNETAYTHHIQRLMVLGNFFLLTECEPRQVLRWFNEMYIDSYDWVMDANVLGMILHADGGYMATKPYAATSAYIHKMSDHCAGCEYRQAEKSGPRSCPFNSLFWRFWNKHESRFSSNPRVKALLSGWNKRPERERVTILETAEGFLKKIDSI